MGTIYTLHGIVIYNNIFFNLVFVFESIKSLRPYFHSLREIQNNVSLDIKLPLTWTYENIIKPYSTITIKVQDKNDKFNLVSLVSQATQEGYLRVWILWQKWSRFGMFLLTTKTFKTLFLLWLKTR